MENTHSGRALRLNWNSRERGLLRISRSLSAATRGSIGERDDLIPGQESTRGREAPVRAVQRE